MLLFYYCFSHLPHVFCALYAFIHPYIIHGSPQPLHHIRAILLLIHLMHLLYIFCTGLVISASLTVSLQCPDYTLTLLGSPYLVVEPSPWSLCPLGARLLIALTCLFLNLRACPFELRCGVAVSRGFPAILGVFDNHYWLKPLL